MYNVHKSLKDQTTNQCPHMEREDSQKQSIDNILNACSSSASSLLAADQLTTEGQGLSVKTLALSVRHLSFLVMRGGDSIASKAVHCGAFSSLCGVLQLWVLLQGHISEAHVGLLQDSIHLAVQTIWHMCIGLSSNKKQAKECVRPLVELLHYACVPRGDDGTDEAILRSSGEWKDALIGTIASALWSICYGFEENQKETLESGGVALLVGLLSQEETSAATRRSIVGSLWHLSTHAEARETIGTAPILSVLHRILTPASSLFPKGSETEEIGRDSGALHNRNNEEDTGDMLPDIRESKKRRAATLMYIAGSETADEQEVEEAQLMAAVVAANLSLDPCLHSALDASGVLRRLSQFVKEKDPERFTMHNLVWTTVKPLVHLMQAQRREANELGALIVASLSRTNRQTSKLFLEGGVEALKRLVSMRARPPEANIATLTAASPLSSRATAQARQSGCCPHCGRSLVASYAEEHAPSALEQGEEEEQEETKYPGEDTNNDKKRKKVQDPYHMSRSLAQFALNNLGIAVPQSDNTSDSTHFGPAGGIDTCGGDANGILVGGNVHPIGSDDLLSLWVSLLSLPPEQGHLLLCKFREESVTPSNLPYLLEEQDLRDTFGLRLGPRRHLVALARAYLKSTRKALQDEEGEGARLASPGHRVLEMKGHEEEHKDADSHTNAPPSVEASTCLVCRDEKADICLVPCGHVVCCQMCGDILKARGDPCILCRRKITALVKPFYV